MIVRISAMIVNIRRSAGGVEHQFLHYANDNLVEVMLDHQFFALDEAMKFFPAGQQAGRIDGPGFAGAPPFDFAVEFVADVLFVFHIPPAAADVKVLKCKPQRSPSCLWHTAHLAWD